MWLRPGREVNRWQAFLQKSKGDGKRGFVVTVWDVPMPSCGFGSSWPWAVCWGSGSAEVMQHRSC